MLWEFKNADVPAVAYILSPKLASSLALSRNFILFSSPANEIKLLASSLALSRNFILFSSPANEIKTDFLGSFTPVAIKDLRNASEISSPKQATSPVELISTRKIGSAPFTLENEN